jgi:hypothetical protein
MRGEKLRRPTQARVALGMGEQDAKASYRKAEERLVEAGGQGAVGRLDEQIAAPAAVARGDQLVILCRRRPCQADLGGRDEGGDRDASSARGGAERHASDRDVLDPDQRVVLAKVWRRRHDLDRTLCRRR